MTAMPQGAAAPVIAMRGAGYYSSHTIGAKAVINAAADLVVDALSRMDLNSAAPFAIADYGAADGGTSMDMMRRAIDAIRAKGGERPIAITYTDLPHNDFLRPVPARARLAAASAASAARRRARRVHLRQRHELLPPDLS